MASYIDGDLDEQALELSARAAEAQSSPQAKAAAARAGGSLSGPSSPRCDGRAVPAAAAATGSPLGVAAGRARALQAPGGAAPASPVAAAGGARPMFVYTLALADRCWYVGTTRHLVNRLAEHRAGGDRGATWTRLHKPLRGFEHTEKCKENDPDGKLLEHYYLQLRMKEHGIDKVRGATYVVENLPRNQVLALAQELFHHAGDEGCDNCGRGTVPHARYQYCDLQECRASTDVCGNPIEQFNRRQPGRGGGGGDGGGGGVVGRGGCGGRGGGAAARKRARRECQACGEDISDRPESHKLCLDCYSTRGSGDSSRRACHECGEDIGDRPESHKFCGGCFASASQGSGGRGGSGRFAGLHAGDEEEGSEEKEEEGEEEDGEEEEESEESESSQSSL